MKLSISPPMALALRSTALVVVAGVGLWCMSAGSWGEQRRLARSERDGAAQLADLQEFLVAGWTAADRAASLDIGAVRHWLPTGFSPHEQKARLLEHLGYDELGERYVKPTERKLLSMAIVS